MERKLLLKITFLFLNFVTMADMVVIPAAGGIFASFPDASPILQMLFLTGPLFPSVIGSLLCGYLAKHISKKYLMIGGYVIFIIGACGGALIDNIYYIVTMRMIVGISYGFVPTAGMGLIAEVFLDEKERSSMMGMYNAASTVLAVVMSLLAGFLAVGNWHHSYYIYLASIPILIMIMAFIPKTPPEGKEASDGASSEKEGLPFVKFLPMVASFLFINIFYNIVLYYIAIYLEEVNLGSASVAGILTSAGSIGSFCFSLLFSTLYMRVKRGIPIIAYLVMALAYVFMAFPSNVWVVGIMCFLAGGAYGLSLGYYYMDASMILPPGVMSLGMGILGACLSLGGFLSSYALGLYKAVLHVDKIAPTFLYIGISLAIGGLLSIILTVRSRKNSVSDVDKTTNSN